MRDYMLVLFALLDVLSDLIVPNGWTRFLMRNVEVGDLSLDLVYMSGHVTVLVFIAMLKQV